MRSHELHAQGWNCAQAVLLAQTEEYGLAPDLARRLAAPFGGGVGGLRRTCGALTALCLLAGLRHGGYAPNDLEAKTPWYALIQRLGAAFTAEFGTSQCAKVLADAVGESSVAPSTRNAEHEAVRPCAHCVRVADRLYARHLARA